MSQDLKRCAFRLSIWDTVLSTNEEFFGNIFGAGEWTARRISLNYIGNESFSLIAILEWWESKGRRFRRDSNRNAQIQALAKAEANTRKERQ